MMYLDFLLVKRDALDDVQTRLLVGFGVAVVSLLEDHLVLCTVQRSIILASVTRIAGDV